MAKTKISELDAAAANNTDINSVDVSEGCAPSGINNAIREMGAMLKRMDNGTDHLTNPNITGDLDVDNININGNTISSTDTNGNINITPNGTGAVAFTTNATFGDNDKAIFGAGSDLQIYHDGSNSFIKDAGPGSLQLHVSGLDVLNAAAGEFIIRAAEDGSVDLYHDNSKKLETTSSGIDVTGSVTADGNFILETSGGGVNYKGLSRAFFGSLHSSNFAVLGSAAKADETANAQMIATETSTGNGLPSAIQLGAGNIDFHTIASSTANAAFDSKRMRIDKNGDISFYADDGTTQGLFWDASTQRLGLGTTGPATELEVEGTITFGTADSTIKDNQLRFNSSGDAFIDHGTTGQDIKFRVSNSSALDTTAVTIDSDGSVGIGSTTPGAKIHLNESGSANAVQRIQASTDFYAAQLHLYGNNVGGAAYNAIKSFVNGDSTPQWEITGPEASTEDQMLFHTGGGERMRLVNQNGGDLNFGGMTTFSFGNTETQINKFQVNSGRDSTSARTHMAFGNPNGQVGGITTNGSATAFNTSSDHRLKQGVEDMTGAIDRVKALAPKRFQFIADADTTVDGFLAHEAQAVVPEAVTGTHNEVDDDGNAVMQGIDQSKLVPLLTAALKESIAKIEDLETRLAALEGA